VSFSDIAFRVIAIGFVVHWIWRFVREDSKRRNQRLPHRDTFQHCERSPYWSGESWRR
jgi:hypothetical protein